MQELDRVLNMIQHGSICLSRTYICPNTSEFTIIDRILSMSNTIHSARSLYKLMSTYREMSVMNTCRLLNMSGF